jgi:hypothetical protein
MKTKYSVAPRGLPLAMVAIVSVAVVAAGVLISAGVIPRLARAASLPSAKVKPGVYTKRIAPELLPKLQPQSAKATTPAELLKLITQGFGSPLILQSSIGAAPPDFTPTEDPTAAAPDAFTKGLWAYFRVATPDDGPGAIKAIWQADLVAGALREELYANGMPSLYNDVITVQLPDGRTEDIGGGVGNVAYGQVFATTTPDEIEARTLASARSADLDVVRMEVFSALQAAPALTVRAQNPEAMIRNPLKAMRTAFGTDPATFEGVYFEVRDASDDSPVLIEAGSFRTGVGHEWIRPDLDPRRVVAGPSGSRSH